MKYRQKLKAARQASNVAYMLEGEYLSKIKETKEYLEDEHINDWTSYLKEEKYKYSYVLQKMNIFKKFGKYADKDCPPSSRLRALLPIVNEDNAKEWYYKAKELLAPDFDNEIRVAKGEPDQDKCEHKNLEIDQYERHTRK